MLFTQNKDIINEIREIKFTNEKELQGLCERNLEKLLNLELIASEFSVANFRIDSLAYDKEANAFIIIEYKNTKIHSVIDQGYSYLAAMLENKANFVLKYSQIKNKIFDIKDINWAQSKIIFISPHFTPYQTGASGFKDLPIELWKIKKFDNNIISFDQIGKTAGSTAKIQEIAPVEESIAVGRDIISKEIKSYSEDDVLNIASDEIKDIYTQLRDFILSEGDEVNVKATKIYIGFYKNRSCLVSIQPQKQALLLWINEQYSNISDPKNIVRDVSNIGHHGCGDCEIKVQNFDNIGYIQDLIKKHLEDKG